MMHPEFKRAIRIVRLVLASEDTFMMAIRLKKKASRGWRGYKADRAFLKTYVGLVDMNIKEIIEAEES